MRTDEEAVEGYWIQAPAPTPDPPGGSRLAAIEARAREGYSSPPQETLDLVGFARAVKGFAYRSPNGYDPAYDEIRDLLSDLENP